MKKRINLWWHDNDGISNFGDVLGPYLVEKLSGRKPKFRRSSRWPWPKTYMVIGSILAAANRNCIVWGAGLIDRHTTVGAAKFHAVRGPETRKILVSQGHKVPQIYGDPAILLPKYYSPRVNAKTEFGIIPHIVDYQYVRKNTPKEIKVIDLTQPIEDVVNDICSCEFTFSSSLHGIIVSHAYNIPSQWVEFSNNLFGDGIKFVDYYESINIKSIKPVVINDLGEADLSLFKSLINEKNNLPHIDLVSLQDGLMSSCPFYVPKVI